MDERLLRFKRVRELAAGGMSDYKIAALTGTPRATVQRWRHQDRPPGLYVELGIDGAWHPPEPRTYCYLLGFYLGDGHLVHRSPNGWTLRIAADRQYPAIIDEVLRAMGVIFEGGHPTKHPYSAGAAYVVGISHPAVGPAFPQHGAGRKHLRRIELAGWQQELTRAHPAALIRGLIHSDGCRTVNRFRTRLPSGRVREYSYVRYFFSNLSGDIREIFLEHCELLGVRATQPSSRNLAISDRGSVAILEEAGGPKM